MLFPAGSFPDPPHLETRKALLLIDLQNDFVNPNGKLYVENVVTFLPKLPGLVSKFRETGEIIWAQTQFVEPQATVSTEFGSYVVVLKDFIDSASGHDLQEEATPAPSTADEVAGIEQSDPGAQEPEAFLAPRPSDTNLSRCCLPGTTGVGLPESLLPVVAQNDIVLLKTHYSAFTDNSFLLSLRKKFITELYVCGSLSNITVYATVLDAVRHGLSVTIVEDCVGYLNEQCHEEAMRQMADAMGANGVDYQELLDDLNGDLGDVVTEDTFPNRFDVQFSNTQRNPDNSQLRPRVQEWISRLDSTQPISTDPVLENVEEGQELIKAYGTKHPRETDVLPGERTLEPTSTDLHVQPEPPLSRTEILRADTPTSLSPPRKRSTGDFDFEDQADNSMHASRHRRLSHDTPASGQPRPKTTRARVRRRAHRPEANTSIATTRSTTASTDVSNFEPAIPTNSARSMPELSLSSVARTNIASQSNSTPNLALSDTTLPGMKVEGDKAQEKSDSQQLYRQIDGARAETSSLETLRAESRNDQESQRQGSEAEAAISSMQTLRTELRRDMVAQWRKGDAKADTLGPIDRQDELGGRPRKAFSTNPTYPVGAFGEGDSTVVYDIISTEDAIHAFSTLKNEVQWQKMYHRSGEVPRLVAVQGEIGLDGRSVPIYRHPADEAPILRPFSLIVQSLRESVEKMLRHPVNHVLIQRYRNGEDSISEHSDKTLDIVRGSDIVNLSLGAQRTMILRGKKSSGRTTPDTPDTYQPRRVQRIPLPNKSLFVLGSKTNQYWLHSIRADKRREAEKSAEELDFDGERISLTFRNIGTFIDPIENTIWGQGATEKEKHMAKPVPLGREAERAGEMMIKAFGEENHRSHDFDWTAVYGEGFDVVNSARGYMLAAA